MDIKVLFLLFPVVYPACPPNWFLESTTSCYMIVKEKKTWAEADRFCAEQNANGHLARINSAEEQTVIDNYVKAHQNEYDSRLWLDGKDEEIEGDWVWDYEYQHLGYTHWNTNEPNNLGGNEDCMEYGKTYHYKWNDIACGSRLQSICEFEKTP